MGRPGLPDARAAPQPARRWPPSCRRSRRCCANRSRARTCLRRGTSWPPRSRVRRWTSTPPVRIESRYFTSLVTGPVAKNMIQAFFFDLQAINAGGSRPEGIGKDPDHQDRCAGRGHDGRRHRLRIGQGRLRRRPQGRHHQKPRRRARATRRSWRPRLSSGAARRREVRRAAGRITPTADPQDFTGVDFVIEAVFENQELKHKVFQEIEDIVEPNAILGSNTSTMPITVWPPGSSARTTFIGIHFFSPVDKMPLVEIIRGERPPMRRWPGCSTTPWPSARPDRGQRQPRFLHQPRDRHLHQRGAGDAR